MLPAADAFLGTTGSAYFPKERLTPRQAIDCIHAAGGLASLAHPVQLRTTGPAETQTVINRLAEAGLDALECYHSDHRPQDIAFLLSLTHRYNLVATGGSDFHGSNKIDVHLGRGKNNVAVPESVLDRLEARWRAQQNVGNTAATPAA